MGAVVGLVFGVGLALVLVGGRASARRPARGAGPLTRLAEQSGIPRATAGSIIGASVSSAVVVGVLALVATAVPVAALIAAVVAGAAPLVLLRRRAAIRLQAVRAAWPDAVDQLVSAVRAGMSLPEALAALGQRGPEVLRPAFVEFEADYRSSGSFAAALDRLQAGLADPVADRVLAAIRVGRDVGGSDLGVVLRTLSALLREDARTRGEIESRQSWTVAAARMAVAAPWLTLALLSTRAEAATAYRTAGGALVLLLCAGLSVIAYRSMLVIARLPSEPRLVRS